MRSILKLLIGTFVSGMAAVSLVVSAGAYTGTYIGNEVSEDGTSILCAGVSEDDMTMSYVSKITSRDLMKEGYIEDRYTGYEYKLGKNVYDYVVYKNMDYVQNDSAVNAATNEHGVSVLTARYNQGENAYDEGVSLETLSEIVAASKKTAGSAVKLIEDILEEDGCANPGYILVSDQRGAYYIEVYSLNEYRGIKLDEDKVFEVSDNYVLLTDDEEFEEVICSGGLELNEPADDYEGIYSDDNISDLADVFALYREADITKCVAVSTYSDVPQEMSAIMWVNPSNPSYSPFVPVSIFAEEINESLSENLSEDSYSKDVASCELSRLAYYCDKNPKQLGEGVTEYWSGLEEVYITEISKNIKSDWLDMYEEDPDDFEAFITEYCDDASAEITENAQELFEDATWYEVKNAKADKADFHAEFDLISYAKKMGWDVSESEEELTFTRDDETIIVSLLEDGYIKKITNDGETETLLIEDVSEELAKAEPKAKLSQAKELVKDNKDEINDFFQEKIKSVPKDGWTAKEALKQLEIIRDELVKLLEVYLDKDISEIKIEDIAELTDAASIEKYAKNLDTKEAEEAVARIAEDTIPLIDKYFGISIEEIAVKLANNELTQEEINELLNGLNRDVHKLFNTYVRKEFAGIIDDKLTDEEIEDLLKEATNEVIRIIGDYSGVDLSEVDVSEITIDDIVSGLKNLDPETKKQIGELFSVDVDECIEAYENGELQIDIEIDTEELGISDEAIEEVISSLYEEDSSEDEDGKDTEKVEKKENADKDKPADLQEKESEVEEKPVAVSEPVSEEVTETTPVEEPAAEIVPEAVAVEEPVIEAVPEVEAPAEEPVEEPVVEVVPEVTVPIQEPVVEAVPESVPESVPVEEPAIEAVPEVSTPVEEPVQESSTVAEADKKDPNADAAQETVDETESEITDESASEETVVPIKIRKKGKKYYAPSWAMKYFK